MTTRTCLIVVLAAGEGTRMRNSRPKVLHTISGRSLIAHVLAVADTIGARVAVVVGPGQEAVVEAARAGMPDAEVYLQHERRGTAHAVLAAQAALGRGAHDGGGVFWGTPVVHT